MNRGQLHEISQYQEKRRKYHLCKIELACTATACLHQNYLFWEKGRAWTLFNGGKIASCAIVLDLNPYLSGRISAQKEQSSLGILMLNVQLFGCMRWTYSSWTHLMLSMYQIRRLNVQLTLDWFAKQRPRCGTTHSTVAQKSCFRYIPESYSYSDESNKFNHCSCTTTSDEQSSEKV